MNIQKVSLSTGDKIGLVSNIATMLKAGISILETIDSLLEDSKSNQKIILETIQEDINQGLHLHESFAKFPRVFDSITINIIKASEEAGTLDTTLEDLSQTFKKQQEFVDKVRGAFAYPMMIFFVFILVFTLILTFVVPRIATVFSRMNTTLPLPTQILMGLSSFVLDHTIALVIGMVAATTGIIMWYRSNKKLFFKAIFSLPLVSNLVRSIDLTNFARSMHMLLSSGIPIVTALELMQGVMYKHETTRLVERAREEVLAGHSFSSGLRLEKGVFPTIALKMIEAGEKTGSLDSAMRDISDYLDRQVTRTLATVTTMIEPLMLVFVGIMIGGMMLAIIAPIYGLIGNFGSR